MTAMSKSEMFSILEYYFTHGRPREYKKYEGPLFDQFPKILKECSPVEAIRAASTLFLFSYTLASEYKHVQETIYEKICLPYKQWIESQTPSTKEAKKTRNKNSYLLILRHAVTSGLYSPGQTSYFLTKLLVENDAQVRIVCLGSLDETFHSLTKKFKNLEIIQIAPNEKREKVLDYLENLCLSGLFTTIFTEQEFSEPSYIAVRHRLDNLVLISAGYYRLPWYSKILKPNVLGGSENDREIITPMPIELELLNPQFNPADLKEVKEKLHFSDKDIVFGCFARLEKFTHDYIERANLILDQIPESKLLIAGPNSQDFLTNHLGERLASGRAAILGPSNAHVLGHVLTFGLETMPTLSGSTVLELYAKSKIVLTSSENVTDIDYIANARIKDFVYNSKKELEILVNKVADPEFRTMNEKKSYDFMNAMYENCKSQYYKIIQNLS